jgi:hypothetical protein
MRRSRSLRTAIWISAVAGLMLACASTETTTPPIQLPPQTASTAESVQERASPAGLWISDAAGPEHEAQVLVITEKSFYWLRTGNWGHSNDDVHEEFAEIIELDPAQSHAKVRLHWIRTNGQFSGFDSPTYTLTYALDGDTLRITDGTDGGNGRQETAYPGPPSTESTVYIRW